MKTSVAPVFRYANKFALFVAVVSVAGHYVAHPNTNKQMKNEALTNHLHDAFLRCGEILPAADIARMTREIECNLEVEFDAQTVLASVREAGELFVDSMIQNEHDTETAVIDGLYCGFPIDPLEVRVAKWENMRPSAIRQKQLEKLTLEVRAYTTASGKKYRYVTRSDGAEFQVVEAGSGLWVIESQKGFATTTATTLKAALCDIANKQSKVTGHA